MKTSALNARSLLVHVSIATWIGNPRDKSLTSELESTHRTDRQTLSVRKRIMKSSELDAVLAFGNRIRKEFESLSRPWFDGGFRLVPSAKFVQTKQRLDTLIDAFNASANEFIACYDSIKERDKIRLNGTYDETDYPTRAELRAKFRAVINVSSLPVVSDDWRIAGIDEETRQNIAAQIEAETDQRIAAGNKEMLAAIRDAIAHLSSRLKDSDATFKRNSVENVIDAANILSELNVTDDKVITEVSDRIKTTFLAMNGTTDQIRESKGLRAKAVDTCADAMREIDETMAGIM